ncbi:hypothetical protein D3C80_1795010 [compost metagenome]
MARHAGSEGVQRAVPFKHVEDLGIMALEMLKQTDKGLLDQPLSWDAGQPHFGREGIENPLFIMMAP